MGRKLEVIVGRSRRQDAPGYHSNNEQQKCTAEEARKNSGLHGAFCPSISVIDLKKNLPDYFTKYRRVFIAQSDDRKAKSKAPEV